MKYQTRILRRVAAAVGRQCLLLAIAMMGMTAVASGAEI